MFRRVIARTVPTLGMDKNTCFIGLLQDLLIKLVRKNVFRTNLSQKNIIYLF